jgi:hypothetical protein
VTGTGGFAQFREGDALLSALRQTFVMPQFAQTLSFDLVALGLDDRTNGRLPDAFEASLLGPDGRPLVPAFRPGASEFFNASPGREVGMAEGSASTAAASRSI